MLKTGKIDNVFFWNGVSHIFQILQNSKTERCSAVNSRGGTPCVEVLIASKKIIYKKIENIGLKGLIMQWNSNCGGLLVFQNFDSSWLDVWLEKLIFYRCLIKVRGEMWFYWSYAEIFDFSKFDLKRFDCISILSIIYCSAVYC